MTWLKSVDGPHQRHARHAETFGYLPLLGCCRLEAQYWRKCYFERQRLFWSDKQRFFSDLLGKALSVPHTSARNHTRLVLFKQLAWNFFHCRGQSCCGLLIWTANCPDLPRFSRSMFFIETLGYWSATKSILRASPTCLITALWIRSARSMKRSGSLGRVCSCAMASTMTAEAFVRFGGISTPSYRSFARADLFVLPSEPS